MEELRLLSALQDMKKNAIRLNIRGDGAPAGRFGGKPDVPAGFVWPTFETDTFHDKEKKPRPLSFLAQFDCASLALLDTEHLLPKTGVLSFFYELGSQTWGYSPQDAGSARVYYFPDKTALHPMDFPETLEEDYQLKEMEFFAKNETQYPDFQDFSESYPNDSGFWQELDWDWEALCDEYEIAFQHLAAPDKNDGALHHQLLGWPVIIQNNMTYECELVSRGYYMGNTLKDIPEDEINEARRNSISDWTLLFELDSDEFGDCELAFGDCGSIYFYIRKTDLAKQRFENVWLISQCY